jgi:NADPH2:quinone reductase
MKTIVVEQTGGPEALKLSEVPRPEPAKDQVLVRIAAAGVNFIDIYHRTGLYKLPLPLTPGMEGAGTVELAGEGVADFHPGERVAWCFARGSYAQYAAIPASALVKVPGGIDLEQAAAIMLQGMTAHYLTRSTYPLKNGDTALVHAAAGGTGLMVVQLAKLAGARVIGVVSTEAKAELARKAGADHVILTGEQDLPARVKELTGGRGADVVYDSVGAATWQKSMDSLRTRGMLVLFGNASGPVPPIEPLLLTQKGSLFLTRPQLAHYIADRAELLARANDLFQWLSEGKLILHIGGRYPLEQAAEAHRALESRQTTGKLLLLVK